MEIREESLTERFEKGNLGFPKWFRDLYPCYPALAEYFKEGLEDFPPEGAIPRSLKSVMAQNVRTKKNAEVFTPSKVVDQMVRLLVEENTKKPLSPTKTFLEVACGEAPFVTTRYEPGTGEFIPFEKRSGLLDRKLQNCPDKGKSYTYLLACLWNAYGTELQADSLYIARVNVLLTAVEFFLRERTEEKLEVSDIYYICEMIRDNFFQMDALTGKSPRGNDVWFRPPGCLNKMTWEDYKNELERECHESIEAD